MTTNDLYDLKIGERLEQERHDILRVIGGWIYIFYNHRKEIVSTEYVKA